VFTHVFFALSPGRSFKTPAVPTWAISISGLEQQLFAFLEILARTAYFPGLNPAPGFGCWHEGGRG